MDYAVKIPVILLVCQTCCRRVCDKGALNGLFFWKMKCNTAVLLWKPEHFDSKTLLFMQTVWGHVMKQSSHPFFKDSHEGFIVCVCTEQTGLLNLCRAAEEGSSSSQRGPFTYPFWSHISSPPLFLPSESSGFLFSRSSAYHLFLHPPQPSLREWKDILGDRSCLSCADPEVLWLSLSLCVWKWWFYARSSLFLWGVVFYESQVCLASVSVSAQMLNKFHASRKALWIVIITGTDNAIYCNSIEWSRFLYPTGFLNCLLFLRLNNMT